MSQNVPAALAGHKPKLLDESGTPFGEGISAFEANESIVIGSGALSEKGTAVWKAPLLGLASRTMQ
ncbi:MAG TPA: hypothetical protein VJU77_12760 [Chthoniobacterales bacterium]|nr:hypothetical protein [Chthoniobacterales bacterium]